MSATWITTALLVCTCVLSTYAQEKDETCLLKFETGPCKALFYRYGYDSTKGKCVTFVYGGCRGNANNFKTEKECNQKCGSIAAKPAVTEDKCKLKLEPGLCRAYFPRYGFSPSQGKCIFFVYGGCGGNDNNFMSEKECKQECASVVVPLARRELSLLRRATQTYSCHPDSPMFSPSKCGWSTKPSKPDYSYSCHPDASNYSPSKCGGSTSGGSNTDKSYSCHPDSPNYSPSKCGGSTSGSSNTDKSYSCHPDSSNYSPEKCGQGRSSSKTRSCHPDSPKCMIG